MLSEPMDADSMVEKGNALFTAGETDAAIAEYNRILERFPDFGRAHYNLGVALQRQGRLRESEEHYRSVSDSSPQFALARSNLSVLELLRHDFARGWDDYEMRIPSGGIEPRILGIPPLDRDGLASVKRVAVWKEQGVGDQILFSTLLPEFARRGIAAVVEVDSRLIDAYRRCLPAIEFVTDLRAGGVLDRYDAHCPMGSIGRLFRRSVESFSAQPQRLLAARTNRVNEIMENLRSGPRVAISWRTFQPTGREHVGFARSAPLDAFAVLGEAGVSLVDVQYGNATAERLAFDERYPRLRVEVPGLDRFNDLEGVLAAIEACDLVVTPSNITAHLAGALGKRCWVTFLGKAPPFHYWAPGPNGRSLWYPSVEIVSKPSWSSWYQAFQEISARLRSELRDVAG